MASNKSKRRQTSEPTHKARQSLNQALTDMRLLKRREWTRPNINVDAYILGDRKLCNLTPEPLEFLIGVGKQEETIKVVERLIRDDENMRKAWDTISKTQLALAKTIEREILNSDRFSADDKASAIKVVKEDVMRNPALRIARHCALSVARKLSDDTGAEYTRRFNILAEQLLKISGQLRNDEHMANQAIASKDDKSPLLLPDAIHLAAQVCALNAERGELVRSGGALGNKKFDLIERLSRDFRQHYRKPLYEVVAIIVSAALDYKVSTEQAKQHMSREKPRIIRA